MTPRVVARYDTDGPFFASFCETALKFTDGHFGGMPLVLEPWQRAFWNDALEVDRRTGLRTYTQAFLLTGKGNGKTQIGSASALYGMTMDAGPFGPELNPQVPIVAAAQKQAAELGNTARIMALKSKPLRDLLQVNKHDIIRLPLPGSDEEEPGRLHWIASDSDTVHGMKPSWGLCDELGSWKKPTLYSIMLQSGATKRRQPFMFTMSHVGEDRFTLLGGIYDELVAHPKTEIYGGRGRNGKMKNEPALMILRDRENKTLVYWYGIGDRDDLDPEDPLVWEACNPASWVSADALRAVKNSLPMRVNPNDFLRWNLNMWVIGQDAFLPTGAWRSCGNEDLVIPAGSRVYLGLDGAQTHDYGAVSMCWPDMTDRARPKYKIVVKLFRATDSETSIVKRMKHHVMRLREKYKIMEAHYDPMFLTESADDLEDIGVNMVRNPQTPGRLAVATTKFREHVVEGLVEHDADQEVAKHVANAVLVDAGENFKRVSKRKSKDKIDGLVAQMFALDGAENAWKRGEIGSRAKVRIIGGRSSS